MVTDVVVKLTTPLPEFEALKSPVNVDEKLLLPAVGTVCVIVRVKVPEAATGPLPEKKVWKFPKLEPVGVFRLVLPNPVNVIISAGPAPNVTEFVPLPEQPPQVKIPDVLKVIGSALACGAAIAIIARISALIIVAFKMLPVIFPLSFSCSLQVLESILTSTNRPASATLASAKATPMPIIVFGDTLPKLHH